MTGWSAYFAMGGYAAFVWPAYAVSIAALAAVAIVSWRGMKRSERLAELDEKPAPSRR
jgi:heme exporter protein D